MPASSTQPFETTHETLAGSHQSLLKYLAKILPGLIRAYALHRQQGLLSLSIKLPRHLIEAKALYAAADFFYTRDKDGLHQFGLGECLRLTASGQDRFQRLEQFFQQQQNRWQWFDPDHTGVEPQAYCAFSYAEQGHDQGLWKAFPNTLIHIPQVSVTLQAQHALITFSANHHQGCSADRLLALWLSPLQSHRPPSGHDDGRTATSDGDGDGDGHTTASDYQEHPHWIHSVNLALASIHAGHIEKLVLTRMASHRLARPTRVDELANRLQQRFPSCTVFSARMGHQRFICATPERLLRLNNGTLDCDAIGGTIGRGADATQDRYLGKRLLADPKARHEHRLVVEAIAQALSPHCEPLRIPDTPCLLRLPNLQHLWTPMQAQVNSSTSLFQLAAALHPTPAVGGSPTSSANQWLAQHEETPRGWYTGAAGWIDRQGQGELAVLLRAALIGPGSAHLFAGAGIVADSDPELEWEETEMKLAAMREALGISTGLLHGVTR